MLYFRLPFSDQILSVVPDSENEAVRFVSFDESEHFSFPGTIAKLPANTGFSRSTNADLPMLPENSLGETREFYLDSITQVIEFVKENQLPKLVLSRRKVVDFEGRTLDLFTTFRNLCEVYPNAFVYVFIKNEQCWLGAFSEVLGKFDKNTHRFDTMSLAGTLPKDEAWSGKEIDEQRAVTDFVENTLGNFTEKVARSETQDHISGNIKHLRTDFSATVAPGDVDALIADLHPTPAVCGIPKDICQKAIRNFEPTARDLYAGYIRVETPGHLSYFVNLRCARIYRYAAIVYVGGGITAESSAEKEWQETELKSEAVLSNLAFI